MKTYLQFGQAGQPSLTKLVSNKTKVTKATQSITSKDTVWMVLNDGKWLRVKAHSSITENYYYVIISNEQIKVTFNH